MSFIISTLAATGLLLPAPPSIISPEPAIIRPEIKASVIPGFPFLSGLPNPIISYVNFVSANASTIVMPTISPNDVAMLFDFGYGSGSAPALVTPSGFTNFQNSTSGATDCRLATCYKILDGSESGATLTGMNATTNNTKRLIIFRVNRGTWQAPTDLNIGNSTTVLTNQVVTPAAIPSVVLAFYGSGDGTVATRGFSGATADAELGSGRAYLKYKIFQINDATPNVTVSKSADADFKNGMASFTFNVTY